MTERRLPTAEELRAAGTTVPSYYDVIRERNERIRKEAANGVTTRQLCERFGLRQSTMWHIVKGGAL